MQNNHIEIAELLRSDVRVLNASSYGDTIWEQAELQVTEPFGSVEAKHPPAVEELSRELYNLGLARIIHRSSLLAEGACKIYLELYGTTLASADSIEARHDAFRRVALILALPENSGRKPNPLPLLLASAEGFADVVTKYLEDGRVDPRFEGCRALDLGAAAGCSSVVRALLAVQSIDLTWSACSCIHLVLENRDHEVLELLWNDSRVDQRPVAGAVFEHACKFNLGRLLESTLRSPYTDPTMNSFIGMSWAAANNNFNVVWRLLRDERVLKAGNKKELLTALGISAKLGHHHILRLLLQVVDMDQADPGNAVLEAACRFKQKAAVLVLLKVNKVRTRETTAWLLAQLAAQANDTRLLVGLLQQYPDIKLSSPKMGISLLEFGHAHCIEAICCAPELRGHADMQAFARNAIVASYRYGLPELVATISKHIPMPDFWWRSTVIAAATRGNSRLVQLFFQQPSVTPQLRFDTAMGLLEMFSSPNYVQDALPNLDHPAVGLHLKYYLPYETLQALFPPQLWETDDYLRLFQITKQNERLLFTGEPWTDLERSQSNQFERFYANLFFDTCLGLFGQPFSSFWEGSDAGMARHFFTIVEQLEEAGKVEPTESHATLKKYLKQVKDAYQEDDQLDKAKVVRAVSGMAVGETYLMGLVSYGAYVNGQEDSHGMFGLVEKTGDNLCNVKVFNPAYRATPGERVYPYEEWRGVDTDEFLKQACGDLPHQFTLVPGQTARSITGAPQDELVKNHLKGTCAGFRFWILAKHLLGMERYMELKVQLLLYFVERLDENFDATVTARWRSLTPHAWWAITHTPHFESRLLKQLGRIEGKPLYQPLRQAVIRSVMARYRISDPEAALRFIEWRKALGRHMHACTHAISQGEQ